MKVKDIRRTCFHALWFSSFYPFIKYVFTASSFQAFANHWQNKDGKARNREKVLGIEILNSAIFRLSCIGEGNGNPLQCSCLENPRDGGAWWAAICGVAQSRPQLKWLSSSSSSSSHVLSALVWSGSLLLWKSITFFFFNFRLQSLEWIDFSLNPSKFQDSF